MYFIDLFVYYYTYTILLLNLQTSHANEFLGNRQCADIMNGSPSHS